MQVKANDKLRRDRATRASFLCAATVSRTLTASNALILIFGGTRTPGLLPAAFCFSITRACEASKRNWHPCTTQDFDHASAVALKAICEEWYD